MNTINYLIFCNHRGLFFILIILLCIGIVTKNFIATKFKKKFQILSAGLIAIICTIALGGIVMIEGKREITPDMYSKLELIANKSVKVKQHLHNYLHDNEYISYIAYCNLKGIYKKNQTESIKKNIKSWK